MLPDAPPITAALIPGLDHLSSNGTTAPPPRFRLFAPQYARVQLTGEYAGAWVDVLLNPGVGLLRNLQTTDGVCDHLHEMIRAWNLDAPDGQLLPVSPAGVAQLDPKMTGAIMDAWSAARAMPKSG